MNRPERADFSPNGQEIPKRSYLERRAIRRINRLALQLPTGSIYAKNDEETIVVDGMQYLTQTIFNLRQCLDERGEDPVTRHTDVLIQRNPHNLNSITTLEVKETEVDDFAVQHGIQPAERGFLLYAESNGLSVHRIKQSVELAVKTVRNAQMGEIPSIPVAYP